MKKNKIKQVVTKKSCFNDKQETMVDENSKLKEFQSNFYKATMK